VLWTAGGRLDPLVLTGLLLLAMAGATVVEAGWASTGRHPALVRAP